MILRIDPDSPVPPYEQIRSQVASMIASGVLDDGARLPPIRQLADDLALAGGTVARAYRELEDQGLIVTRGRHGTFVEGSTARPRSKEGLEQLRQAAHAFAVRASQLGVDTKDALAAAQAALTELPTARNSA
ncbi:MAG: GntR family transcriptional regulator [Actinomycetota bacterium]